MKKIYIVTILLFFILNVNAFSASINDTLTSIENGVFGYDFNNQPDIPRIERLEEYLYGEKRTGDIKIRLDSLQNDAGINVVDKSIKNSQESKNNSLANKINAARKVKMNSQNLTEDETVEYAIVDKMEKSLYNKTFKSDDIYQRLDRLELTVFQNTSDLDLNARVNKLSAVLDPSYNKMPEKEATEQELKNLFNDNGAVHIDEKTIPFQLSALESAILKHEYVKDNNSGRLSRLEQKLFNRTFLNDTDIKRLQRVLVAFEAKKDSYKYENNKKMQNMATLSQIGGILLMILAILL